MTAKPKTRRKRRTREQVEAADLRAKQEQRRRLEHQREADLRAQRQDDWMRLGSAHTGFYVCGWCGDSKYCRGKTKLRMACEPCYLDKGPPKISKPKVSSAGTLHNRNQRKGGHHAPASQFRSHRTG